MRIRFPFIFLFAGMLFSGCIHQYTRAPEKPNDYRTYSELTDEPKQDSSFEPVVFTIYFPVNSEEFDPIYLQQIYLAGDELQKHKDSCLMIYGFADFDGRFEINKQLALARANWIRDSLIASGIDRQFIIKVEGMNPIVLPEGASLEEKKHCRRGEIHVVPCLATRNQQFETDPNDPFRYK